MKEVQFLNSLSILKIVTQTLMFSGMICLWFSCGDSTEVADNQSDKIEVSDREQHRPVYHFTPPAKWMNDPNGMVYYEGEYHLFYQHYPDSNVWGPMHWGHAVSTDLVRWEHLPIALYPDSLGLIFSGSAVIDWNNTSGFGKDGAPPMVAIFTYHLMSGEKSGAIDFQYQGIAYSNDKGRNWTKYEGNPVIPNPGIKDFRDPKVVWDKNSKQWVMVFAAHDHVKFYGSPDLKKWTHLSDWGKEWGAHGGLWECPDLFPIKVNGEDESKWVLIQSLNPGSANGGSGTQYFVGDFDGKNFNLDPAFAENVKDGNAVWLDHGRDNYAGVTWSDIPATDGRRIFMGWMSNWDYAQVVPTYEWRSAMTVPTTLTLHKKGADYRLRSVPVKELDGLRGGKNDRYTLEKTDGFKDFKVPLHFSPASMEATFEFEKADLAITLSNSKGETYSVGYEADKNRFFSNRMNAGKKAFSEKFAPKIHYAPRKSDSPTVKMRLLFDVGSCELFADDGQTVMTDIYFPNEDFNSLSLNGNARVPLATFYKLTP